MAYIIKQNRPKGCKNAHQPALTTISFDVRYIGFETFFLSDQIFLADMKGRKRKRKQSERREEEINLNAVVISKASEVACVL